MWIIFLALGVILLIIGFLFVQLSKSRQEVSENSANVKKSEKVYSHFAEKLKDIEYPECYDITKVMADNILEYLSNNGYNEKIVSITGECPDTYSAYPLEWYELFDEMHNMDAEDR